MAEISTAVPEITFATVNEPLLSASPATVPAPFAGGDRAPARVPMLLGLFAGRCGSSARVRQNVALEMEDWQEDWSYSLPVVVICSLWNLALVVVAVVTLFWIAREETNVELRIWICGYSMLCVAHAMLLLVEYKRRNWRSSTAPAAFSIFMSLTSSGSSSEEVRDHVTRVRKCEMTNTVTSYVWWVVGFIWMLSSYNENTTPCLFWLTLAFLAIDMFFLALRSLIVCLVSVAYCFCLPCIIAFMYYIRRRQEYAPEIYISNLPNYMFKAANRDVEQPDVRVSRLIPLKPTGPYFSTEGVILTEHVYCCICLCHYKDGEHLLLLPCNHHFHPTCIMNWLRVKPICPLCKSLVE